MTIHLGRPLLNASCDRPGRRRENPPTANPKGSSMSSLFGLAPGGVYLAINVTINAVRSYRTLSPLPIKTLGLNWRFAFCGTFPRVAPAGCYPAPCLRGARTFLYPNPKA